MRRWGLAVVVLVVVACTATRAADPPAQDKEAEQQRQERLEWVAKVLEKEGKYGELFIMLPNFSYHGNQTRHKQM